MYVCVCVHTCARARYVDRYIDENCTQLNSYVTWIRFSLSVNPVLA